ncbi:WXG100-like domain-containing protein [Lentzea cavernae]|uniref:Outer membrane channel protein CpnT-like N-terminal domain-containing protein n=1 Tax=Lentzea cavernae TaxID=2020703 RepID=A0ABQ3MFM7_9PSEU|nr:hypothetical protein [Lentzea cavernae]GHH44131.1 hypothetical protein GCM10017774_43160 [Lentzea cavernae]
MAMPEPQDDFGFWESIKDKSVDTLWPPDSEYVAWELADAWVEAAVLMENAAKAWGTAGTRLPSAWIDVAGVQFTNAVNSMPANYENLAANMRLLADGARSYGDQIREVRLSILWEITVNIGLFVALSWIPGGGFLAAALSRAVAGRITAMITGAAGRIAAGFAKLGVEVAKESFDEAFNNTATQVTSLLMGTRDEFNADELRDATVTGGVGGVLGEGFGKAVKLGGAAARGLVPSLPAAPASGLARNLNAGLGSGVNNAVTSPAAGYIVENWGNLAALTDLSGYGQKISEGGLAAALSGAPRSMVIDAVQQRNPGHEAQATALADRLVGNPPPQAGEGPGNGDLSGGPGADPPPPPDRQTPADPATTPDRQSAANPSPPPDQQTPADPTSTQDRQAAANPSATPDQQGTANPSATPDQQGTANPSTTPDPSTSPDRQSAADAVAAPDGSTESGSTAESSSETDSTTAPPGGRGADAETGGRTTNHGPLRSDSSPTELPPGEHERRAAPASAEEQNSSAPQHASSDETTARPASADVVESVENPGTATDAPAAPAQEAAEHEAASTVEPAREAQQQDGQAQETPIAPASVAPVQGAPAQSGPAHSSSTGSTTSGQAATPTANPPGATTKAPTRSGPVEQDENAEVHPAAENSAPERTSQEQATPDQAGPEQSPPAQDAATPHQVTPGPAGAVLAAAAVTPSAPEPQAAEPRSAPAHTAVTAAPPAPAPSGDVESGPLPPPQAQPHSLGAFKNGLRRDGSGRITHIAGRAVREKLRELAHQRAALYDELRKQPGGPLGRDQTGGVVALVMDMRTGEVFESTNGTNPSVVLKRFVPPIRARIMAMFHDPARFGGNTVNGRTTPQRRFKGFDSPFRHAEVRAADAALTKNPAARLDDLAADVVWAGAKGKKPLSPAAFCPNCSEILHDVRSNGGKTVHHPEEGTVDGPTGWEGDTNNAQHRAPTPRLRGSGDAVPARSPRTYPVGAVPHSRFHANRAATPHLSRVRAHVRQAMEHIGRSAGMAEVQPLGGARYLVTRPDGSTFVVLVVAGETRGENPAEVVVPAKGTPVVRISQRAEQLIIARAVSGALAQLSERLAGNQAEDLLTAERHPGSHVELSAADHGRLAEVRTLAREHREASAFSRRRRLIAAEMRALVEHLGLHADAPSGPQRQVLTDPGVRAVLARHAAAGSRRPSWAGEPTGEPQGRAFLAHLASEAMPGTGAAVALLGGGQPMLALGVGAVTAGASVTSTLVKRWYGKRDRALSREGHRFLAARRAHEAAVRRAELLTPLLARARSTGIDLTEAGPPEPGPSDERPPDHQPYGPRLVNRGLPPMAGGGAAGLATLAGLEFRYAAAYLGIAGLAVTFGPLLERLLKSRTTSQEWSRFDEAGRAIEARAAKFDEAFVAKLHALMDRLDRLAGSAPTGSPETARPVADAESHDAALHRFLASSAPNSAVDAARGGADATARVGDAASDALLNGGVRTALGVLIAAFLDRSSLRDEQQELINRFEFDKAAKLAEQVALEQAALDALLGEVDGHLTAAEAAQQLRDALPGVRQDRRGRPTGYRSWRATRKWDLKRATATQAVVVGSALAFDQGAATMIVGGAAAAMLAASFVVKYLFRRAEVLASGELALADRAEEQAAEAAETLALHEFIQRFMAREVLAATGAPVDPLPAPPQVPKILRKRDRRFPDHIEALTAHERERMLREPRPWSLLGSRLAALNRIDRMTARVREFAAHERHTGQSAPLSRAFTDLSALWTAYQQLVQHGTPMPTDHELRTNSRLRSGAEATENVLPQRLQEILDESTVTPAGRAFYPGDDEMLADASQVPPQPGSYTIDVHGNATSVRFGTERLTADDLAALIEADPNWHGEPIRLIACNTGHEDNGFAQQLATRLGVPVTAPSDYAGTFADGTPFASTAHVDESGTLVPKIPPDGVWRTFQPQLSLSKPVVELKPRIENNYTPAPAEHEPAEPPVIGISELPPARVGPHRVGIFTEGLRRDDAGLITHVGGVPVRLALRELTVERAKLYWSPDNAGLRKDLKDRYRDLNRELQSQGMWPGREEVRHEMRLVLKRLEDLDAMEKALSRKSTGGCLALQMDLVTGEVFESTNGREGRKIIWHKFQAQIRMRIDAIRRSAPHGYPGPEYRGDDAQEKRRFPGYDAPHRHAEVRAADAALAARPDARLSDLAADIVFLKAGYPEASCCPNCSAILHDVRTNLPKRHYDPETDRSSLGTTTGWEGHGENDTPRRLRGDPAEPGPAKPDVRPDLFLPDDEEVRFGEPRPLYSGDDRLWPDELADLVTSSPEWTEQPVRLAVLDGQLDAEFLRRFAAMVGVEVRVPEESVTEGFLACSSGTLVITHDPAPPPDGGWRTLEPRTEEMS